MPQAPKNKSKVVWVDYTLSEEQKQQMQAELKNWTALASALEEMVGEGYKLSVQWDTWNDCMACFVTPGPDDHDNQGKVLAGRGKSVFSAVRGAVFRHISIFGKVWRETSARPVDD